MTSDFTHPAPDASTDRNATLSLTGNDGRTRIRMTVDSTNTARLEFLDAQGNVVGRLP